MTGLAELLASFHAPLTMFCPAKKISGSATYLY